MDTWNIGPHLVELEPPDILHCRIRGSMSLGEAKEMIRIIERDVVPKVGPVFFFVYLGEGFLTLDLEIRAYLGTLKAPWRAAAAIGGDAATRAVTNIAFRAISLVSGHKAPMRMFKTVEGAHAFAAELRAAEKVSAARG